MPELRSPSRKPIILPVIHPNAGIDVAYRQRLDRLLARMQKSLIYWLSAAYKANPPALAMDASSAADLEAEMRSLGRRWQRRFDQGAEELARYFAKGVAARSDAALQAILRNAGFTVKFKVSPAWNDIRTATVNANVNLIKSIASEHLSDVQGIVMRSVQEGRDLGTLTKALEKQYGVTRRRAALIARDQNNKATAAITRVRQRELGIDKAIWVHSAAGKEPRPKHVAFAAGRLGGPYYDIDKGAKIADDGGYTWPGVEINCRCISRPVIPGLDQ
jgi:uncharacterized protein with gpF-like domain